jgi:hypothetical protein
LTADDEIEISSDDTNEDIAPLLHAKRRQARDVPPPPWYFGRDGLGALLHIGYKYYS